MSVIDLHELGMKTRGEVWSFSGPDACGPGLRPPEASGGEKGLLFR